MQRTFSMEGLTLTAINIAKNGLFHIDLCQSHLSMKRSQGHSSGSKCLHLAIFIQGLTLTATITAEKCTIPGRSKSKSLEWEK